jgi:hypothetical protein
MEKKPYYTDEERPMPTYVVSFSTRRDLHPGDDNAPLEVQGHPDFLFWYREWQAGPTVLALEYMPLYWVKDGAKDGWQVGGRMVQAASKEALQVAMAGMQWGRQVSGEPSEIER